MVVTVITAVTVFAAMFILLTTPDRRCPKGDKHDYGDWFPHGFADFVRVCSKCGHWHYK